MCRNSECVINTEILDGTLADVAHSDPSPLNTIVGLDKLLEIGCFFPKLLVKSVVVWRSVRRNVGVEVL
jgi:hypothetical protein